MLVGALVILSALASAETLWAQELLGWWKRGLLEVDLSEGSWVRYASFERSEGRAVTDTLEVTVLETREDGTSWLAFSAASTADRTLLLVDPDRLDPEADLFDALLRMVRQLGDGTLVEEDVDEHRQSRLVQRHFEDPFSDPMLARTALADTVVAGTSLRRELVRLTEEQREERSLGRTTLVLETSLASSAVLSPDVPVFGVWWAETTTVVTSRSEGGGGRTRTDPLETLVRLRCVGFGREASGVLPRGLATSDR